MTAAALCGILLLDKPLGLSSNAALQRVRRLAGGIKAGHSGSLDPLASGMLPVCLGEATRLAGQLLEGDKTYRFTLKLGERSATGDAEGAIIERASVPPLEHGRIERVLAGFLGPQQQVPPMYSALKRDGEPLYRLARAGLTVERPPRAIVVGALQLEGLADERLELSLRCSKGTYVRVLGEDIARALGTCGRLDALRRCGVEPFGDEPMITLAELEALSAAGVTWPLLPPDRAVAHLPSMPLRAHEATALRQGRSLPAHCAGAQRWRLYDAQGGFLGLGTSDESGTLRVERLFSRAVAV